MSVGERRPARMMSALILRKIVDDVILPQLPDDAPAVDMVWDPTVALMARIRAGETADGLMAIEWALDALAADGLIEAAGRRRLVRAAFGLAVAGGAPKPDVSTVEGLRRTLLETPSLVYSRTGASGIYFERLIEALGVASEVRAKATVIPTGLTAELVANGRADLAIQQISELLAVDGVDLVGPFPDAVQETTDFGVAVFADAAYRPGVMGFIDALFTPRARRAYVESGLTPLF